MRDEHGKIEGDVLIQDEFTLHGMITGRTTVARDGLFHLHGMCCSDLVLDPGSRAIIHGMVVGIVINRGGIVDVYGTIGSLRDEGDTITNVAPNAIVRDRQ